jgi:phosphatidylglycerophosphate synthase
VLGSFVCWLGDRLLAPVNRAANRLGIGPLAANTMELLAGTGAAACFVLQLKWAALALLGAHGAFDYLEGGLRRASGSGGASASSVWRHAIVDKVSDVLLLVAIAWGGFASWWLAIAAASSALAVTGLGLWLHRKAPPLRERTFFDRADRLILLLLATAVGQIPSAIWLILAMNVFALAHRLTVLWRARFLCCHERVRV